MVEALTVPIFRALKSLLGEIGSADNPPGLGVDWAVNDRPAVEVRQITGLSETQAPALYLYPSNETTERSATSGNQNIMRSTFGILIAGFLDTYDPFVVEQWILAVRQALGRDRTLHGSCVDSMILGVVRAFEGDQLPQATFGLTLSIQYRFIEQTPHVRI